jgi:phage baseplate assembly protein W
MATIQKIYSDIDFAFTRKPVVNDVSISYDRNAVIRSIRNLLLTKHYEKPFNPQLGSNLDALLFENFTPLIASSIENEISNIIANYEPRAILDKVEIKALPDQNSYSARIQFYIENDTLPTTVTFILERNR